MSCDCTTCFYCEAPLSPRHEHDHMPTPDRNGGTETVAACVNCHDLKDRVSLNAWDPVLLDRALGEAGPFGRILLAKLYAMLSDAEQAAA